MYPAKWAEKSPEKAAIIHATTGEQTSFRELNDRSNQLAQLMWDKGLRPGDHIASFLENDIRFFDIVWAALRSGLYLTTVNRYLTAEEAGYIVHDCEAKVLITSGYLKDVAIDIAQHTPNCTTRLVINGEIEGYADYFDALAAYPAAPLASQPLGAFMLYSSGTTGRPKGIKRPLSGVMVSDDPNGLGTMQQLLWGFDENSVYLSPAPLYHSAPAAFATATLASGGSVVVMPRFDPVAALQAIETHKVTHSQWVPTMFTRMLKLPEKDRSGFDLSSHKIAIHAAAPCPVEVKKQMLEWWGPIIHEYYAGTEANGFAVVGPEDWLRYPGTVGQALGSVIHICDDDGHELPAGETGIVYFEQEEMSFSYHNSPEKTKDVQHPQHPNWTALGDVGYVNEEGFLFLTDRATFMIISGGVNIYPQEIEDAIVMHDKVADVAVIGVPNEEMGEEVKAVVQLAPSVSPSEAVSAELLAYAREHVAHYKCPKSIDFLEELPRLPTGKLYKRLLKDKYWGREGSKIV